MRPQLRNERRFDHRVKHDNSRLRRFETLETRELLSGQTLLISDPAPYSAAYVNGVYRDAVGHAADANTLNWGITELDQGQPLLLISSAAVGNLGYTATLVETAYQHYLGRDADPNALNFWANALRAGIRDEQLVSALVGSDEFYQRAGGTDTNWVAAAYQTVLGRPPEPTALSWATAQLSQGVSRVTLAFALASSLEHERDVVTADYNQFLHATPDDTAINLWASELANTQTTNETLVMGLLANPGYYQQQTGVSPSAIPVSRNDEAAWAARNQQIAAAAATQGNSQVLFIGDSITQLWQTAGQATWNQNYAGLNAFNAGIGGDETQNILWRIENGELNGLSPKVVVLMAGINNITFGDSPQQVADGVTAVVTALRDRLPEAKILVLGILPISLPSAIFQQEITASNQLIAQLADGQNVFFLDLGSAFTNLDGSPRAELYADAVHPNALGYAVWGQAMAPEFNYVLGVAETESRSGFPA